MPLEAPTVVNQHRHAIKSALANLPGGRLLLWTLVSAPFWFLETQECCLTSIGSSESSPASHLGYTQLSVLSCATCTGPNYLVPSATTAKTPSCVASPAILPAEKPTQEEITTPRAFGSRKWQDTWLFLPLPLHNFSPYSFDETWNGGGFFLEFLLLFEKLCLLVWEILQEEAFLVMPEPQKKEHQDQVQT